MWEPDPSKLGQVLSWSPVGVGLFHLLEGEDYVYGCGQNRQLAQ